jgi:hypothetical protein
MSSSALADLSGLVALAHERNLDLRPVLLRVQTDLFAAAPNRDQGTIDAFEALALGFLAVVDDDTAGIVARKLAPLADTPPRVIEALLARGGQARQGVIQGMPRLPRTVAAAALADEPALAPVLAARADLDAATLVELLGRGEDVVDLAIARNRSMVLGRTLHHLVERGRERPHLAAALLAREDLSVWDEAALYVHADARRRAGIRGRLETHAPLIAAFRRAALPRADSAMRDDLLARAADGDGPGFRALLAEALRVNLVSAAPWRFDHEAHREVVALALVAAGLPSEDAIRVFLTLDREIARSVRAVFHLAEIARTTPRAVALYLTEATLGTTSGRESARHAPLLDASGAPDRGQLLSRPFPARIPSVPHRRDLKVG